MCHFKFQRGSSFLKTPAIVFWTGGHVALLPGQLVVEGGGGCGCAGQGGRCKFVEANPVDVRVVRRLITSLERQHGLKY